MAERREHREHSSLEQVLQTIKNEHVRFINLEFTDMVGVAKACRFPETHAISQESELIAARRLLHAAQGPVFIQAQVRQEEVARVLPSRDGNEIKLRFLRAVAKLDQV